ncbi:MAG: ArsB/NhaD family transporter [Desulfobacterales bacterium]|nr:ArsB/NhaD family transporter [Desulfobacterales bacterium]
MVIIFISSTYAFAGHGNSAHSKTSITDGDSIILSGTILDSHSEPIKEAHIQIYINNQHVYESETGPSGKYVADFQYPKDQIKSAQIRIDVQKASFKTQSIMLQGNDLASKNNRYYHVEHITMQRHLGPAFWISTLVFIIIYALITFELLHRTLAAMLGAGLMLLISYTIGTINPEFRIFSYEAAMHSIDMNVIFLLMGMMIIVGVLKNTGVFQWCAYISYKLAKGNVFLLAIYLMIFTAVTSAFLDNVTTMLLLSGVAIEICVSLSLNPLVLLIPLVLASNIGGTSTLIGDPPNIMIGSYAGLTFMDFVIALVWVCILSMVALIFYSKLVWGKAYSSAKVQKIDEYIQELKEKYQITDVTLLTYGGIILGFVILLFLSHGFWHMEVSIAAMTGAAVLLIVAVVTKKVDLLHLIEKDIEWMTLLFFIFLFIVVGAVETTGLLSWIADQILTLSQGNFVIACSLILWVSAILSAFVDNIPFTATMLPIVAYLTAAIPGSENTLWWSLALGACFGGNGTMIGASANVVTVGIAESKGYKISFIGFLKVAFPYMIISVAIAHAWLLIFRP